MKDGSATIAKALASITSLEELEGFIATLKDPSIQTKKPTTNEWHQIADKKLRMQRGKT